MASTAWTAGWEAEDCPPSRFKGILDSAWLVIRVLICAAVTVACAGAQTLLNYDQNIDGGIPWVIASAASALGTTLSFMSILSGNPSRITRAIMAIILVVCASFDLMNNASQHATVSDNQRARSQLDATAHETAATKRERLNKSIEAQVKIAGHDAPDVFQAAIDKAANEKPGLWAVSMQCTHVTYSPKWPGEKKFCEDINDIRVKLAAARARDKDQADLNAIVDVVAAPSAADEKIITFRHFFKWIGIKGEAPKDKEANLADYNETASAVSWLRGGLILFLFTVIPWVVQVYLFETISPDRVERQRLQEARESAARAADRKARRAAKLEIWGRYRRRIEASVKARFAPKAPPKVPEPVPDIGHDDDEETAAEPPVRVVPEAPQPVQCSDPTLNAVINSGLQRVESDRVSTKEFFEKVWKPWHEERGRDPGKQTGMTKRLKAMGLFEMFKAGSDTWIADHAIRAKNERPKFRVVS